MRPLVSILIPAYNAERWVADAIRSALDQTWERKEVIVIDDGSTDATLARSRFFERDRVKVVSQENAGASAARNHAFSLAQGHLIQWLDADDILDPAKIERQIRNSSDMPERYLLSSAWGRFYYRPERAVPRPSALWQNLSPVEWLQIKMETNAWMAIQSWLVPRSVATSAGLWNTDLSADDDGDYFSRVVCASEGVTFIPDAFSRCRMANPNSLSKGIRSRRSLESQLKSLFLQIELLRRHDDGSRTRSAALQLLQRWLIHYFPEHPDLVAAMRKAANDLGGTLLEPKMTGAMRAIAASFGLTTAKRVQGALRGARAAATRTCHRLLPIG